MDAVNNITLSYTFFKTNEEECESKYQHPRPCMRLPVLLCGLYANLRCCVCSVMAPVEPTATESATDVTEASNADALQSDLSKLREQELLLRDQGRSLAVTSQYVGLCLARCLAG
jgi:hypothetical protein